MKNWLLAFMALMYAGRAFATAYGSWDSFTTTTTPYTATITVNGWGADSASGTSGVVANVYVDNQFMTQVPVSQARPDVAAAYGRQDFLNSGYAATFSTEYLSIGTHTVSIWVGGGPSGWNSFSTSIVNGSTFTVTAGVRPTISWVSGSNQFPAAGSNYTVQATGHSDNGTLASVNVWKDGQPFAFDGPNPSIPSEYTNKTTDPNLLNESANTVHLFSAQATASNGQKSPMIYWVVKVGGSSITYGDLSVAAVESTNPNGTGNPWLPYSGNFATDTANFNSVFLSLANSTSTRTLEFADDTYKLHAANGSMQGLSGVSNLTLAGGAHGRTVLNWAVRDANGVAYDPSTYSSMFSYPTFSWNPQISDSSKQPHVCLNIGSDCSYITVSDITFDTDYTARIGGEGSHIKLSGQHQHITNCAFLHATGFAVFVGQTPTASSITIDGNTIQNTWADGIHVLSASNVTVSNNTINNTGDDAIAITSEGVASGGSTPVGVTVTGNKILNTHWRGIYIYGATNVDVENNTVSNTGRDQPGIQADKYTWSGGTVWNNCLQFLNNYVEYGGTMSGHNSTDSGDQPDNAGRGYTLDSIHNLHMDFTPPASAPAHALGTYGAYKVSPQGAFITNVDNSYTVGTPYTYSCVNTRYLNTNTTDGGGGGFLLGSGTSTLPNSQ